MANRLHDWWQQWLITADEATTQAKLALGSRSGPMSPSAPLDLSGLEPRILFSATPIDPSSLPGVDAAAMVVEVELESAASETDSIATLAEETPSDQALRELIIIDSVVPDIEQLLDDLSASGRDAEVFVLDADRDGIDQITEILESRTDVDSIHIISHAEDGAVRLGNVWLGESNLVGYAGQIASWQSSLSSDADILLYGCDLAETAGGQTLIESIAALSGADVAASADDTGHADFNADWDLEYTTGSIETPIVFSDQLQQNWHGKLSTLSVDIFYDSLDGGDGLRSLREAVIVANATGDTILLSAGTYTLSLGSSGEDGAMAGDLDITGNVTIIGAGAGLTTIDADGIDRVFEVIGAGQLTMSDLTVEGGFVTGGGPGDGGGINVDNGAGQLTLDRVIISSNFADDGAGILNEGTMTLTGVWITANGDQLLTTEGGGIHNRGTAVLNNVTISGNEAINGAGIHNDSSANSLTLTNVTISGNTASGIGGGIHNQKTATITNSTIVFNDANNGGGVTNNGGVVNLKNTIIALNTGTNPDVESAFNSLGHNLIGDGSGSTGLDDGVDDDQVGDGVTPIDPIIDSDLAFNGVFNPTHALLAGSTAIDPVGLTGAPATDQRDVTRDATADIGAFEYTVGTGHTTATESRGSQNAIALDAAGNYVTVWSVLGQDGDGFGVYARRYDASGTALTDEIRVNESTSLDQRWASVASDDDGNFVVTWTSDQNGTDEDVYARVFDSSGSAATSEFVVSDQTSGHQKDSVVTMDKATGDFVIAWEGDGPGDADGIHFRRFNADGTAKDVSDVLANMVDRGIESNAAITMQTAGKFVIVWDVSNDVYFQRFNDDGSIDGSEEQVDTGITFSSGAAVASDASGNFTVVYHVTSLGVWGRGFNADGSENYGYFNVGPSDSDSPSIAMADDGSFVVVFEQTSDTDGEAVNGRKYDNSGIPLAPQFQINANEVGDQRDASVAVTSTDDFVVIWSGDGPAEANGPVVEQFNFTPPIASTGVDTAAPNSESVLEDNTLVFSVTGGNAITVDDGSAADPILRTILNVTNGVLDLATTAGLTSVVGDGTGNIAITGLESDINAAIDGLTYTPTDDYHGPANLEVTTDLQGDLLGYYSFENGLGDDDSPLGGNDGTPSGGVTSTFDGDRNSEVLVLDGVDDNIVMTGNRFGTPTDVTLAAWVNVSATNNHDVISIGGSIALRLNDTGNGDGVTGFFHDGGGWNHTDTTQFIGGDGWHHVAFTFDDASNTQVIYLDGVALGTTSYTGSINWAHAPNSTLGSHANGSSYWLDGMIDDARIYDRALSVSEIEALAIDQHSDTNTVAITVNPDNDLPTGIPTITGTVEEDQTLNAVTTGISDVDGLGTFTYQWLRNGGVIGGATGSSYVLGDDDVSQLISVQVSYTDLDFTLEGPLTSLQTGPVANVNDDPTVANPIADQSADQGDPFTFQFAANTFDDVDGDSLTYTPGLLPTWLNFDAGTRTFSGTPGAADAGAIIVRVTANDGNTGSQFDEFVLTVAADATPSDLEGTHTKLGGLSLNEDGGNNAYLIADDGEAIAGGLTALTLEVQFTSTTRPAVSDSATFVSYANGVEASGDDLRFGVRRVSGTQYDLEFAVDGNFVFATSFNAGVLFDGETHRASLAWDNLAGEYAFFIDGAAVDSGSGLAVGHTIAGGGALTIGTDQDSIGGSFEASQVFQGTLHDLRIFNDVRSSGAISGTVNSTLRYDATNMVANWTFNDLSTDGVVTDKVSGNNLTVQSVALGGGFLDSNPELTYEVRETSSNGTFIGKVAGTDAEREAMIATILAADAQLSYSAETGKFYRLVATTETWFDAQTAATSAGLSGVNGQLVTIRSAAEQEIVHAITGGQTIWLGGSDQTIEGEWHWYHGVSESQQFWSGDETGVIAGGRYQNWDPTQPNDPVGDEDFARMIGSGLWEDATSLAAHAYVVEWNADDVLDQTEPLFYTLVDDAGGRFQIHSDRGSIAVANTSLIDYETTTSHSIIVRVTDSAGNTYDESFTIDVREVNEPPVTVAHSYTVNAGFTLTTTAPGVLSGAYDPEGNSFNAVLVTTTTNGALTLNANGSFVYTPNDGFSGTDTFTYDAWDGSAGSTTAVTITVNPLGILPPPPPIDPGDDDETDDPPPPPPNDDSEETEESEETNDTNPTSDGPSTQPSTPPAPRPAEVLVSFIPAEDPAVAWMAQGMGIDSATSAEKQGSNENSEKSGSKGSDEFGLRSQINSIYQISTYDPQWQNLDSFRDDLLDGERFQSLIVGAAVGVSIAVTVGQAVWAVKAGYMASTLVTTMPLLRSIDPLPVLEYVDDSGPVDQESLQSIVE